MTTEARGAVVDVARIDVLRANGLGDLMFALPALAALRAAYPEAKITLLGSPLHVELLRTRPAPVDDVVLVPPSRGVWLPADHHEGAAEQEEFFASRRGLDIDVAIQLHGGGRWSNPFVERLGARLTVGMRDDDAAPLDRWVPYVYYQREVLRLLEVVALVGAEPVGVEPVLAVTEQDRVAAATVLGDTGSYAVLAPSATDPRRRWPADRFAAVGDQLASLGLNVVVVGSGDEEALARKVAASMRARSTVCAGRTNLDALVGVLAGASVTVANDNGPANLARAVGCPTVTIYWCGNVVTAGPMTTARHRVAVGWTVACPVCGAGQREARCPHDPSYVADVPTSEVAALVHAVVRCS